MSMGNWFLLDFMNKKDSSLQIDKYLSSFILFRINGDSHWRQYGRLVVQTKDQFPDTPDFQIDLTLCASKRAVFNITQTVTYNARTMSTWTCTGSIAVRLEQVTVSRNNGPVRSSWIREALGYLAFWDNPAC